MLPREALVGGQVAASRLRVLRLVHCTEFHHTN